MGVAERLQAHQPSVSSTAKVATVAPRPSVAGSTAAINTPSKDRPSRQATTRLRWASLPPRRAPHDWWATATTL